MTECKSKSMAFFAQKFGAIAKRLFKNISINKNINDPVIHTRPSKDYKKMES